MKNGLVGNSYKDLKAKKKQVIEKISFAIKNKLNTLFIEKGYTLVALQEDLNRIISEADIQNFDYNLAMIKIEKCVLEILSKMETLVPKAGVDMKKVNNLLINKKQTKVGNQKNSLTETIDKSDKNDINKQQQDIKLQNLKEKENSEWALIAKHNYNKHIEEENERKMKEHEKRLEVKKMLDEQIKEKYQQKIIEKKDIEEYVRVQKHENTIFENNEKIRKQELVQKIAEQKKNQEKIIEENKKQKENLQNELKKIDLQMLDKAKCEIQKEQEIILKKKLEERDKFKKVIEENKEREIIRKIDNENQKKENIKAMEEYSKVIEKQEQERNKKFQNRLENINYNVINNANISKQNATVQKKESQKIEKNMQEKMYKIF
jgi:hypothetical protein